RRGAGATAGGRAAGRFNLSGYRLSGSAIALAYNDVPDATPTSAGWGPTPLATTAAVLATVTGGYTTLLMHFVGLPSLTLQRQAVVSLQGGGMPMCGGQLCPIDPFAICQQEADAMDANPTVLQPIWAGNAAPNEKQCNVTHWSGLILLPGAQDQCSGLPGSQTYQDMIGPPVSGIPPAIGTKVTLTDMPCNLIANWVAN